MIPTTHLPALLLSVFTLLTVTRCSTQSAPSIQGKIQLSEGWKPMVYLIQPRNLAEIASSFSGIVMDSARIAEDGSFAFPKVALSIESMLFQLCVQKVGNRFPNQLLDEIPLAANYMPVVLTPNTSLHITAEAHLFQATFALQNPSAENTTLMELRDIRHKAWRAEQLWLETQNHADESLLLEHEAALLRYQKPLMAFADSTAHFWPALVAARWVSPTNDYERVPEFLFHLCEKWRGKTAETAWSDQICQSGNREKLPQLIGDKIPDYLLPMAAGDSIQLYKLLGKQLTILDIWASWCAPCRKENREVLVPLWERHKDQGLQILGYSIDSSPAAWKAAISKDGAAWPHASHLNGDASPFLETLRITTIPANFILDAQGKVIAKNLHGAALEAFVEAYVK